VNWIDIKRDDLVNGIRLLEMVPYRPGIPSSDSVRVIPSKKQLEFSVASSVTGIVRVPMSGSLERTEEFFVDRKLLLPFVLLGRKWRGDFRTREQEGKWLIRQGSRRAELALKDKVKGYTKWRDRNAKDEVKLSEELRNMLLAANTCATSDPSLPQFNCVYIIGRKVMASNRTIIFMGVNKEESNLRIPFPLGVIPLLSDGLVKKVGIEGELVVLDCGNGYLEGTVSADALKSFPRKSLVEQVEHGKTSWPVIGSLPAERISNLLSRLTEYISGVKREDLMLTLEIGEGKIKARVKVLQAVFEEVLEVEEAKKEALVALPLDHVRPILEYMAKSCEKIKIRCNEEKKTPYILSGAGVDLLVGRKT
jgi:hypothetical protein